MTFDPINFLQELLKFDSTNPPGNEKESIHFIRDTLSVFGIECTLYAKDENRPNLVSMIKGSGKKSPILLYGHVDVVPANPQQWTYNPFDARIENGNIYGRGTLDMKGGLTMLIANFIAMSQQHLTHDVILTVLSDEEVAGEYGAAYLVEHFPHLFENVKYAIGEFGGFPIYIAEKKTYLIQVAEKQVSWLQLEINGTPGHAAFPEKDGLIFKLANILLKINEHDLPIVESNFTELFLDKLSAFIGNTLIKNKRIDKAYVDSILVELEPYEKLFSVMFQNSVNVTRINGGSKTNVLPQEIILELDGRLLPGQKPNHLIHDLSQQLGLNKDQFTILNYVANPQENVDWSLYNDLAETLKEMDPLAHVIPIMLGGSTDARHFSKLGIQTYGYLPMNLPKGFNVLNKIHGIDECIPVECLHFGIEAIKIFFEKYQS